MAASVAATAALRDKRSRCSDQATTDSMPATEGVSAATTSNTKNTVPTSCPPGMSAKAAGSTLKTRSGPWAGSMPKRNTSGKTISVASSDTMRMDTTVKVAERSKELSAGA